MGGGFAGLYAAKGLTGDRLDVTLVDRQNHHVFSPLLYQVATAQLAPGEIAQPLRSLLRGHANIQVLLGEAVDLDPTARVVRLADGATLPYDTLIVATGTRHSWFGHDDWEPLAPGLKSIDDALGIRRRILLAFEEAERETDPDARAAWMTFVVVGGGPTGVELAGALGEVARDALRREFRSIDPTMARIVLVEGMDRVLPTYPPACRAGGRRPRQPGRDGPYRDPGDGHHGRRRGAWRRPPAPSTWRRGPSSGRPVSR